MSETRTGYFEGTGGVKLYYEDTGCQRRSKTTSLAGLKMHHLA